MPKKSGKSLVLAPLGRSADNGGDMPFINPEVIALARVQTRFQISRTLGTYVFSNGFDSAEVPGTPYGTPVIAPIGVNGVVLFLSEPVSQGLIVAAPNGEESNEGGIKAISDVVEVSTHSNPVPFLSPLVKTRWYYGAQGLGGLLPPYVSVDPKKAVVVKFFLQDGSGYSGSCVFDIVVFRNPMTHYKPRVIYGIQPNVIVYPPGVTP